jgi:hypothetical protein
MGTPSELSVGRRLFALLVGQLYLLTVSVLFSSVTKVPFVIVLLITLLSAAVIMAVLAIFGVRALNHRGSAVQFTLSTVFLVLIPLSIYLAALRWLIQGLPIERMDGTAWLVVSVVSIVFMLLSTAILLWFAEALVWVALLFLRGFSRLRARRNG